MGRDLIRSGASLHRIDMAGGRVNLREIAQWHWHEGRGPDPTTWKVRATEYGLSGSVTHLLPWSAVVWLTWGQSTTTPWVGRGPASWAPLTAKLAAEAERTLGDETAGPLAQLRAGVAAARGRGLLVETTAAGFGAMAGPSPRSKTGWPTGSALTLPPPS